MDTISNFLCVEKMGWSDAYSQSMKPDVVVKPVYGEELTEQGDTTPEATQSVSLVKTDVSNPQP